MGRWGIIAIAIAVSGCATSKSLKARAAFDLDCKAFNLEIIEIDSVTRGVRGCGKRVTYIASCEPHPFGACTWVLNRDAAPNSHEEEPEKAPGVSKQSETDLSLSGPQWRFQLRAPGQASAAPLAVALLIETGVAHRCEMTLVADDNPLTLERQRTKPHDHYWVHRAHLPHRELATLVEARKVVVGTCKQRVELLGAPLNALRDFARTRLRLGAPQVQAAHAPATPPEPKTTPTPGVAPPEAPQGERTEGPERQDSPAVSTKNADELTQRLRRLSDLLERGAITQQEHDAQRTAIIESL